MCVFTIFQAFIRVLRQVRNFVVISGTKESLRDEGRSVLTVETLLNKDVFVLLMLHSDTHDDTIPFFCSLMDIINA